MTAIVFVFVFVFGIDNDSDWGRCALIPRALNISSRITLTLQTAGGAAAYTFLRDNPALEAYTSFLAGVR